MTQTSSPASRNADSVVPSNRDDAPPVPRSRSVHIIKRHSPDGPPPALSTLHHQPAAKGSADVTGVLTRALGGYVRMVAKAVGVPPEGTTFEVTDTATAYLALACRAADHPDRDVMLVWNTSQGWVVSIETTPTEPPIMLSRSTGNLVPAPEAVARFVIESITAHGARPVPATLLPHTDWSDLADRMSRHGRAH